MTVKEGWQRFLEKDQPSAFENSLLPKMAPSPSFQFKTYGNWSDTGMNGAATDIRDAALKGRK